MPSSTSVAVIGAGIAGLTAAFRLKQAGFNPVVFEQADYVGGRIKSVRRGPFLFDIGAFIYLGSYSDSVELMREVGLASQLGRFEAYGAMPRGGVLHFLDLRTPIRTILGSGYLSAGSKLRLVKLFWLLFRHWRDLNYHDATRVADLDNDTVTSYCERELNPEILDYVAGVVVRGPWLSDPSYASVVQLLWTLKNFFKPWFYGLEDGMDALPRALAQRVEVRLGCNVENVTEHGSYVDVVHRTGGPSRSERFDGCIIATTADRALAMFPQMYGVQRQFYESTEYITSVNTHIALAKRPANPATYIMVSARENPDLCGVIVDHLKAGGRVPSGKGMLTVFCRHEWCAKNLDVPDTAVLQQVLAMIRPYYGDLSSEIDDYAVGRWPQVVPFMRKGRFRQVAAYQKSLNPSARVQLAGDLEPVGGVNAALVSGRRAAERLTARFR